MKRVLITDDSTFMRNSIKKILEGNGFEIAGEANNGLKAFELYKELHPDIVTLDITMSQMSGLEALSEIIKFDENAKVVMVSAMGQDFYIKQALESGAKGFIVKPFKAPSVLATLSSL